MQICPVGLMKEMLKGTCTGFSKHVYQLSLHQATNALTQNATHYNYQTPTSLNCGIMKQIYTSQTHLRLCTTLPILNVTMLKFQNIYNISTYRYYSIVILKLYSNDWFQAKLSNCFSSVRNVEKKHPLPWYVIRWVLTPIIWSPTPAVAACGFTFISWWQPKHEQQHGYHHAQKVKPEAATAVLGLKTMGVRTSETCLAVNKRQDNKLEKLLHLIGD